MNGRPEPTSSRLGSIGAALLFGLATIGAVQFLKPDSGVTTAPLSNLAAAIAPAPEGAPAAAPTADAFGRSGEVKVRLTLPGERVEFPIAIAGTGDSLSYIWVSAIDSASTEPPRVLSAAPVIAPQRPGFYHLAILRGVSREVLSEPTLAVMVPFSQKLGGQLNGYRIGTYLAERLGTGHDRPVGFVEVRP